MFRCLEYTAFLWKAKGRHGTHSPFAYWLADVVARQKQFPSNQDFSEISSVKTKNFLNKLKHSLPDYPILMPKQKEDLPPNIFKGIEPGLFILGADLPLFFLEASFLDLLHPDSIFVILNPHQATNKFKWQALIELPQFHFSADCFDFGLLSPRPGQAKEHFYLKLG
jgi:hypothetical protein